MSSPAASRRVPAYTAETGWHEDLLKRYGEIIDILVMVEFAELEVMKTFSYKKCEKVLKETEKSHSESLRFFKALRVVEKILRTDLELYMPHVKSILSCSENTPAPTPTLSSKVLRFHQALMVVEEILKTSQDPELYKPHVESMWSWYENTRAPTPP